MSALIVIVTVSEKYCTGRIDTPFLDTAQAGVAMVQSVAQVVDSNRQ